MGGLQPMQTKQERQQNTMWQLAHLRWVIERPVCEVLWQSRPLAHRARGGRTSSTIGASREVGAISRALIAAISSRVSVDMGVGLGTYGAAARATATLGNGCAFISTMVGVLASR